ncbi:MAG: quinolinate synthase NadA, partial [Paenibacillaceae bacterium]|nr:quinolinate synthase NadA [Paenibacillaceae bacterium]
MGTTTLDQDSLVHRQEQQRVLRERLEELKQQRNAIVLAHYYQREEVQAVADFRGDSLLLAQ